MQPRTEGFFFYQLQVDHYGIFLGGARCQHFSFCPHLPVAEANFQAITSQEIRDSLFYLALLYGTETLSHPCCAENMGLQITHDLTHFQIRASAAWEQPADTTFFPAPQAGMSLRSGLLSHFSVPEPWLRDFSHEKANHKTKSSEALSQDWLYLKENVGKFKLKGALKSNDSFSGKQLRGE